MKQTDTLKRLNAVMKDINGDNTQILRALQDQIDMMDVPGNTYSFHLHDANKNVMQVTDGNGLANGVNAYSPYGANIGNVTNPFGFSSEYFSHTINAISYNYRSLFANLGRWGNKDPLGEIYSKNLYSFSINSPINKLGYKLGVTNFSYPLHLVVDNFFLGRCLVSCCHLDEPPKKHPPIL